MDPFLDVDGVVAPFAAEAGVCADELLDRVVALVSLAGVAAVFYDALVACVFCLPVIVLSNVSFSLSNF